MVAPPVSPAIVIVPNYKAKLQQESEEINKFFDKGFKDISTISKLYKHSYYKISI